MIKYEVLVLGELATNCYLVWDEKTKEGVVIDPADEGVAISEIIEAKKIKLKYILVTHGHFDHLMGALELKLIYQIPFACSSKDQFLLERQRETAKYFLGREIEVPNFTKIDIDLDKTDNLHLGRAKIKIVKTPGHSPGGVSFLVEGLLFTGDTLFANGVGRTDLSYSSTKDLQESLAKLREYTGVAILPGHGEIR